MVLWHGAKNSWHLTMNYNSWHVIKHVELLAYCFIMAGLLPVFKSLKGTLLQQSSGWQCGTVLLWAELADCPSL